MVVCNNTIEVVYSIYIGETGHYIVCIHGIVRRICVNTNQGTNAQ